MFDYNPGERVRNVLMELYPASKPSSFLEKLDQDLFGEGEIADLFYMSCINYIMRRLITTAAYYRRRYPPNAYPSNRYKVELRKFFRDYTAYNERLSNELVELLSHCLDVAESGPSDTVRARIRRKAENQGRKCYICGKILNYDTSAIGGDASSVDHGWPHSLGGGNHGENLQVACRECDNTLKLDHIDASDYHYEHIALTTVSYQDYLESERQHKPRRMKEFERAVFTKSNFSCAGCGQPAYRIGDLRIGRKEFEDSWHFLNLEAYCTACFPEE